MSSVPDEENMALRPRWVRLCRRLRPFFVFLWGTVVLGLLLNMTANLYTLWLSWIWSHPVLTVVLFGGLLLFTLIVMIGSREHTHRPSFSAHHERSVVLRMLRKAYTEQQESSLQSAIKRINLDLHERFDLTLTKRLSSIQPGQTERLLPSGTTIVEAYDQAGRGLFITGGPGAGKSTLLYDLAQELLTRAEQDEKHPFPVVLTLSSWGTKRLPYEEWIAWELEQRYGPSRRFWGRLLREERLLFLLDGLDEVALSSRRTCVDAINTYHAEHITPLVVCSRLEEYQAQVQQLMLQSAVIVQPLTREQVKTYLVQAGKPLAAVRKVLRTNPALWELLTTPLMLSIVTLTYQGKKIKDLPRIGSVAAQQQQIFASYLDRMLHSPRKHRTVSPGQMLCWLLWLARQMSQHSQSLFYLEQLQPDWLPTGLAQRLYRWFGVLLPGIVIGVLVALSVNMFFFHYNNDWDILINGLPGGVLGGLLSSRHLIPPKVDLLYSRRYLLTILGAAVLLGLGTGLGVMMGDKIEGRSFSVSLLDGSVIGFWTLLLTLLLFRKRALQLSQVAKRFTRAKKGTWSYILTIDFFGPDLLVGGLFGLSFGLSSGLSSGLSHGLNYGLRASLLNGLSAGLGGVLICPLLMHRAILVEPTEILVWSWKSFRRSLMKKVHMRNVFIVGISTAMIGWISWLLLGRWNYMGLGLSFGLNWGLSIGGSYWLLAGLFQGVSSDIFQEQQRIVPNQGIWRSARNGLLLGLLYGSIGALIGSFILPLRYKWSIGLNYELHAILIIGLAVGLLMVMLHGGLAWWRHWVLRLLLWRAGAISWRYVPMLDEATQCILLRKEGGGYRFIHDLLHHYMASFDTIASSSNATPPSP